MGLLVEDRVPAFFADVVEDIASANFAEVSLVLRTAGARRSCGMLLRLYDQWDARRHASIQEPFRAIDASRLLAGIKTYDLKRLPAGNIELDILRHIADADLDVILAASSAVRGYEAKLSSRHGVWSYRFGEGPDGSSALPYLRELLDGSNLMRVRLVRWGADPTQDATLWEATFAGLHSDSFSLREARRRPGWACTSACIQKLRELHESADGCLDAAPTETDTATTNVRKVSNTELLGWLAPKLASKVVRRITGTPRTAHWQMAVRVGDGRLWGDDALNTDGFRWIESPPGYLYADPFLIRHNSRTWLFYENYSYSEQRAVIDCGEVLADGTVSESRSVLRRPYHLSFPQVFQYGEDFFMVPETAGNRTVELYRAVRFPDEWKLEKVLYSGAPAVDTAVWHDGTFWWFFSTLKEARGDGYMLFLFFSRELDGEWQSHPANPICTDVRYARGAGSLFRQNGRLLRPNQDCSVRYGYRLNCQEVITLTPDSYAEKPLFTLDPSTWSGMIGVHTYNRCPGAEVIDGCILASMAQTGGYESAAVASGRAGLQTA